MANIESHTNRSVTLKFEDIVYKVGLTKEGLRLQGGQVEEKLILNGITGMVLPGEILAMLGPSGSGKTTLLTALGGKLGGKLSGEITYNGKSFSNVMKRNTGFISQDDILYPHLTVTETLVFTALLRLPNSLTKQEKILQAEAVITQLGLTKCKNIIVGDPSVKGISGGQRKRVSIGQELLLNPSLLFLDEPTSGLDSTTAQWIVFTLSEQAKEGRTIVMTIHQPSSKLFYMFDKVLLLSEGNPLYFGKGSEVMDYFSSIAFAPSVTMNPADFLLDLANGVLSYNDSHENQALVKQTLVSAYKSNLASKVKAEVQATDNHFGDRSEDKQVARWVTTWRQQFVVLISRELKERKHVSFSGLNIFQVLAITFLTGLLWWKSDISHLQDQMGLLFAYTGFWGFFALLNALYAFPTDRLILEKERSSGMYRLSAYFMSKTVSDLPMELVLPTIYIIITYWMAGFKHNAVNFLYTLSIVLFYVLVCQGLGFALGALLMDLQTATALGSVIMVSSQLAGGFFVQRAPSFIGWIKYISVSQHAYKLLLGSQYKNTDTYICTTTTRVLCLVGDYPALKMVGLNGQVLSAVVLALMFVGFRLIAYLALMRIGEAKKRTG